MTLKGHILKRAFLNALFIFLLSSCAKPPHSWNRAGVSAVQPSHCSIMYLPPENNFRNLEIELQKSDTNTLVYLTLYGSPITPESDGLVPVTITISGNPETYRSPVLAGGHRVMLPENARSALLNALENHLEISISLYKYNTHVHYEGFDTNYPELHNPSFFSLPF